VDGLHIHIHIRVEKSIYAYCQLMLDLRGGLEAVIQIG